MNPPNESFLSGTHSVPVEVFMPATPSERCPAVLVLHGSFGLSPAYRNDIVSFALALSARGFAAVMPHYLEATGTTAGAGVLPLIEQMQPVWRGIASDTLTWMAGDARFDPARFALLGFSLGANLALAVAMDPPSTLHPCCVVDFFGPTQGLESHWSRLPPIMILYGADDKIVPPAESAHLVTLLAAAGKKKGTGYQVKSFPGEGHGFKGKALAQSRDEAVQFIAQSIGSAVK